MNKLYELLKKNNINPKKYEKKGNITIIYTKDDRYVFKNSKIDMKILTYLKSRSFDYMPFFLESTEYQLTKYIESLDIPGEKKILDLARIIGLLHSKTTFYKEIDKDEYLKLYEDLDGNLNYLYTHYTDLITIIESKVFPSPSEQLLSVNISKIYDYISENKKRLDAWYSMIKKNTKKRNVVLHGNPDLSHFILNDKPYLTSWDKAQIGLPVFDVYKLYNRHALEYDFEEVLKSYEKVYPLTKDEKLLLNILISMPDILTLKGRQFDECVKITRMMEKMYKTERLISPETSKE